MLMLEYIKPLIRDRKRTFLNVITTFVEFYLTAQVHTLRNIVLNFFSTRFKTFNDIKM